MKETLFIYSIFLIFVQVFSSDDKVLMGQSVLYGISSLTQETHNKSICYKQLHLLYKSINYHHVWAIKALDASGQPRSGFFYGNNLWLGSHTQCSDISNRKPFEVNYEKVKHADPTPYDYPPFPLGFTVVHFKHNSTLQQHTQLPLEFIIQLGLCLPKTCSSDDLSELLVHYLNEKYLEVQNLYDLNLELIQVKTLDQDTSWMLKRPETIILLFITCSVIALAIIGTVFDVRTHNRAKNLITGHNGNINGKQTPNSVFEGELVSKSLEKQSSTLGEILRCFSIYSNVKKLVHTKLPSDSIAVIHGLRFFGMLWVIMVHALFYMADYLEDVPYAYRLSEPIFSQILTNATYCVDTYLFLSGFLLAYLFFKSKHNKSSTKNKSVKYGKKFMEFIMMCCNRFLRLTPPYLVTILFANVMYGYYRKTSSIAFSENVDIMCSKYWWRNILYINNLYPRSEMCLSWSWYLSIDTQFFTISAFLLILSTIAFKLAATITITLIIVNVIATTYKSYAVGYIPTMDEQFINLDAIYDLPWNRIGPYMVGIITAYILFVKLQNKLVLKEKIRILLWVLFPLLNIWILFTIYTRQLTVEFSAIYMGTSRTLWAVGLAWLLIACCTGNARALEKFLSFRGWIPLSRLTYCAYLLNPIVANMIYLGSEATYKSSLATFGIIVVGLTLLAFYFAFIFSLLFESPFILLTKMLFNWLVGKNRVNNKPDQV